MTEASRPASASAEESTPLGELEDLIVEQPDDNSTDIDDAPSPALHDALPAGSHTVFWIEVLLLPACTYHFTELRKTMNRLYIRSRPNWVSAQVIPLSS